MTWLPQEPRTGHWMVRCCRFCPMVAARLYIAHTTADPVSGEPMDRSPHLAAQIGLDHVDYRHLWMMLEFCEASPEQRAAIASPAEVERAPRKPIGYYHVALPDRPNSDDWNNWHGAMSALVDAGDPPAEVLRDNRDNLTVFEQVDRVAHNKLMRALGGGR